HEPPSPSGVPALPAHHRPQHPQIARSASRRRQLRNAQAPQGQGLAQEPPPLSPPLHPDIGLLDQFDRTLLRPDHRRRHPPRRLPQRRRTQDRNRSLSRAAQCRTQTVRLDRPGRRHPQKSRPRATSVRVTTLEMRLFGADIGLADHAKAAMAGSCSRGIEDEPAGMTIKDAVAAPFWRVKTLDEMSREEWESLCDGCARCCLVKLEDEDTGGIHFTDIGCRLLNAKTCRCQDYERRNRRVPDCVKLTPAAVRALTWLPVTCAYRLVAKGKDLPDWHPLVSG